MELSKKRKETMVHQLHGSSDGMYGLIKDGFFDNKLKYPDRKDYNVKKKCGECGTMHTDTDAELKYKNAMVAYRAEKGELHKLFTFAAMFDYGLDNLKKPVYDKVFALAWDRGHSAGMYEVYNCLADLADLMILTIEHGYNINIARAEGKLKNG